MSDVHGVQGPRQQKNKLKTQNQPSRFLGKVDEFGNIDAVLVRQNDKNDEKEADNFGSQRSETESGFWF